ncbi:hypothetical protein [Flagellimonas aequoris]|uniref:Uncharacterized protein n=1 Tax=Flagellimonas aequoris TaxID=2306997 RepID=A0A418N6W7_9FLAO|nr:hypothetical protein [Allomuricauda aequoris]RIV70622.1 hypothetical protein D2U88_09650 [Allomuricauda aequoris]TXK02057.1 hypothetical protein FQ019_09575 [Allomuricauda aequoris]
MFWNSTKGEKLMEFFLRNINSYQNGYSLRNENKSTIKKIKNIEKECESIINSVLNYFSYHKDIELTDMYLDLKKSKYDFWEKLFFHCTVLSTTEILLESSDFEKNKAVTRSISAYSNELNEIRKYSDGGVEYVTLRLDLIKSKIEMNLITIPKLFHKG